MFLGWRPPLEARGRSPKAQPFQRPRQQPQQLQLAAAATSSSCHNKATNPPQRHEHTCCCKNFGSIEIGSGMAPWAGALIIILSPLWETVRGPFGFCIEFASAFSAWGVMSVGGESRAHDIASWLTRIPIDTPLPEVAKGITGA